jgi:predicted O-methyltransferase YrrM
MNFKLLLKRSYERIKYPMLSNSFNIESHLTFTERTTLYRLAKNKNSVIEIGSFLGASATAFVPALAESGVLYAIDTWKNDAMSEGIRDTKSDFIKNVGAHIQNIRMIQGYSSQMCEVLSNTIKSPVDILFIDGDHSFEGALADWENYKQFLATGSIVIFHDFGWAEGVKRVINDYLLNSVSEFNNLPNLWWGVLK